MLSLSTISLQPQYLLWRLTWLDAIRVHFWPVSTWPWMMCNATSRSVSHQQWQEQRTVVTELELETAVITIRIYRHCMGRPPHWWFAVTATGDTVSQVWDYPVTKYQTDQSSAFPLSITHGMSKLWIWALNNSLSVTQTAMFLVVPYNTITRAACFSSHDIILLQTHGSSSRLVPLFRSHYI